MNKQLTLAVSLLACMSTSLFAGRGALNAEKNAWTAPLKEDHTIRIPAYQLSLSPDSDKGIVTITPGKDGQWKVRGDRPGTITLLIQKNKRTHPHEYHYRVVEPSV